MQAFKTKWFANWATREGLTSRALWASVEEIDQGLVDANLGGYVVKKRVALDGRGKRGGARTLLAFKRGDKAFFLYGFAKNQQDNITANELKTLKLLAAELLSYTSQQLAAAVAAQELHEVREDDDET
jgi:hypothetical protein